jgi:hypothetical protein
MNLTHHQMATRHMATEVEHINRLIYTKDLSVSKAKQMMADAAVAAAKHCPDCVIKFGINAGRAWFNIL